MGEKKPKTLKPPVWWLNTFFLFGFMLFVFAVIGAIKGEAAIRDPGQIREKGLVLMYLVGGVLMLVNGWLTHQQNVQAYKEEN